jgi:hypothetical protein
MVFLLLIAIFAQNLCRVAFPYLTPQYIPHRNRKALKYSNLRLSEYTVLVETHLSSPRERSNPLLKSQLLADR